MTSTTSATRVPAEPAPSGSAGARPVSRRGIPARVRIMGWVILLMAVVLVTVALVTRTLLVRQLDESVNAAVEQEAREFNGVAAGGVDRATGQPFRGIRELLHNHLQRQYPNDDEVLVGWVRDGAGTQVLRQARESPFPLHQRPDVLNPLLASPESHGIAATDIGEMRWVKVAVSSPADPGAQGTFLVGYFVDSDRSEVNDTVGTLMLVSLAGLLLAAAASWLLAGRVLAPVRLVHTAAAQITGQDLTRRIPVEGSDEFAALAEQFNAMLDRLQHAFATQREFLDDASHELRTPITIIRGHLELMDPLTDDPAERVATVRLCTDELDRMSRIVEDLLLLAKAERPDFVQPEPVELAELTSDLHAKIRALGDRRWRLESIAEGTVLLDSQRITQAVVQLAQNAVQHTGDGDEILLGTALQDGRVSLWITDRGPGVAAPDAELIFQRFSRGTAGGTGHRGGAGLGLAIVRAIADAHHGSTKLVSTPGDGATFGLDLPAPPEGGR